MTKLRPPYSTEQAMLRIVGAIGWDGATAALAPLTEGAVRKKTDPDTHGSLTFEEALKLDSAYQAATGAGAPLLESYAHRLKIAIEVHRATAAEIALAAGKVAKESGEAVNAIILATQPGATPFDRETATREIEQAQGALTAAAAKIGAGPVDALSSTTGADT